MPILPVFHRLLLREGTRGDDTHEGAVSIGSFIGEAFSAAEGGSRGHAYIEGFFVRGILAVFIPVGHAAHEVFQVDPSHEFDAVASGKGEAGVIGHHVPGAILYVP